MEYKERQNNRRSIRLPNYDYAQTGAYFVTIGTYNRDSLLGEILCCDMALTSAGQVVLKCWNDLANHYSHVETDEFVVMPNHVHGIIVLTDQQRMNPIAENVGATHYLKLFAPSRHSRLDASTNCGRPRACPSGSATITSE